MRAESEKSVLPIHSYLLFLYHFFTFIQKSKRSLGSTHICIPILTLGRRDLSGCFSVHIYAFCSSYSSYFAFLRISSKIFRAKMERAITTIIYHNVFIVLHILKVLLKCHPVNPF